MLHHRSLSPPFCRASSRSRFHSLLRKYYDRRWSPDCFRLSLSFRSSLNSYIRHRHATISQISFSWKKRKNGYEAFRRSSRSIEDRSMFTRRFFIRVTRPFRPFAFYGLALANRRKRHRKLAIDRYTSSWKTLFETTPYATHHIPSRLPGYRYLQ